MEFFQQLGSIFFQFTLHLTAIMHQDYISLHFFRIINVGFSDGVILSSLPPFNILLICSVIVLLPIHNNYIFLLTSLFVSLCVKKSGLVICKELLFIGYSYFF